MRLKTQTQLDLERTEAVQRLTGAYAMPTDRMALLYSRYSSAKQVRDSINKGLQQADGLIQRALDIGWKREHTTLFIENSMTKDGRIRSVSGTIPIEDRAGISTVIEHVKTGKAGAILCDDISRLTRDADLVDAATLARACKEHNTLIITNDRTFNFKLQRDYDAYIAEAQAAAAFLELHIKGKMLRNRTRKADSGKVAGGVAPVGLMLDKNTIEGSTAKHGYNYLPSPHRTGVAWLYKRFAEVGASRNDLLREMKAMADSGKPLFPVHPDIDPKSMFLQEVKRDGVLLGWTVASREGLTGILTNPHYIGHLVFNGKIVKRDAHQAIVEYDLWQYAFDHLSPTDLEHRPIDRPTRAVRYSRPESEQTALLFGTRHNGTPVIDGVDGTHVYVQAPDNDYVVLDKHSSAINGYKTSIRIPTLDSLIETRLLSVLYLSQVVAESSTKGTIYGMRPDFHEEMIDFDRALQDRTSVPDTTLATIEAEIAQVKSDLEYSSHVMNVATRTGLYEKLNRLSQRRDKLVQAEENKARIARQLEQAKQDVHYASERWAGWDLARKRSFIHLVTESIALEELAPGWLRVSIQWSQVLGGLLDHFYLWRGSGTLWTKEEVALLQARYPTGTRMELMHLLPTRTWTAIHRKATLLSLVRIADSDPLPFSLDISLSDLGVFAHYGLEDAPYAKDKDKRLWLVTVQAPQHTMGTCWDNPGTEIFPVP